MSSIIDALQLREDDVKLMIAANTQLGSRNMDYQMEQYIFGRSKAGINIINVKKTWEKLLLAARAIVAVENPADVCAIASNIHAQRAVLKFAKYTGATAVAGRFTPGTFTNQIQAAFREPRLLIVSCPRADHQPITEAAYVNLPVIGFANTDSPIRHVDIAIPCNNKAVHSIGLVWWLLTREVLRMRGVISRDTPWDVMPDLFFHRSAEEQEKDQKEEAVPVDQQWNQPAAPANVDDWGESTLPAPGLPAVGGGFGAVGQPAAADDWGAATTDDWGAPVSGQDWSTGNVAAPTNTEGTWE